MPATPVSRAAGIRGWGREGSGWPPVTARLLDSTLYALPSELPFSPWSQPSVAPGALIEPILHRQRPHRGSKG